MTRFVAGMFSIVLMGGTSGVSSQTTSTGSEPALSLSKGQAFPNKSIRIITGGVGGASDTAARLIGPAISGSLGQPVIIDNRGSGVIPGQIVSSAPPDGYTVLCYGSPLWIGPLLEKTPYDPVRDFSPITLAIRSPNVLVVHPSVPVASVKELIVLAKAKSGVLNYASTGTGSTSHLAAEVFKAMAMVNIVRINYTSSAVGDVDLLSGRLDMTFGGATPVAPHIKSGRLKALAVTSLQPSALFPKLPTVAAAGLPGYEVVGVVALFAPAKTPEAIINRLNQETVSFLKTGQAKERFFNAGQEVVGSTPEELGATVKSDMALLGKVIKNAGIHSE